MGKRDQSIPFPDPVIEDQLLSNFYFDKKQKRPNDLVKIGRKKITKSQEKVKIVVEKIRAEYLNDYVKIDEKIKVHFAKKKCTDDSEFMAIHRGLALIFTYYYLSRLSFLELPYDQFTYPHRELSLNEMLVGMNSDGILHHFGKYLNDVKYKDRHALHATINQFIEYHKIFKKHVTKDKLIYLGSKNHTTQDDYYRFGFPKNENRCFNDDGYGSEIYPIPVPPRNDWTGFQITSLDHYFYSFWLRRYVEGNNIIFLKLLKFALYMLE